MIFGDMLEVVMAMTQDHKAAEIAAAAEVLGLDSLRAADILGRLWDESFEEGRMAALDELQDRFCVCMK
jgi:hypothetical protein